MESRYVIALRPRRECPQTTGDLMQAISALALQVVEGEGARAVTVRMTEEEAAAARKAIQFATISKEVDLELLDESAAR